MTRKKGMSNRWNVSLQHHFRILKTALPHLEAANQLRISGQWRANRPLILFFLSLTRPITTDVATTGN